MVGLGIVYIDEEQDLSNIKSYAEKLKPGGTLLVVASEEMTGYAVDDVVSNGLELKRLAINAPTHETLGDTYNREGRYGVLWAVRLGKAGRKDERWIFNKPEHLTFHTGFFEHKKLSDLVIDLTNIHSNGETSVLTNSQEILDTVKTIRNNVEYFKSEEEYTLDKFEKQEIDVSQHPTFDVKVNEIMEKDCFDLLANMEDNTIDLVLTDPPYNISVENTKEMYGDGRVGMDFGCVTPDTKILTQEGVKHYKELKVGDIIPTLNVQGIVEYQPILKINEYDFEGELVKYKHRNGEFLFTDNHRHVFLDKGDIKVEEFEEFKDFSGLSLHDGTVLNTYFQHTGKEEYEGKVWCPTVENGTFIAVKDDEYIFTGNSWDYGFDTEKWMNYIAPKVKEGGSMVVFNSYKNIGIMWKVLKEHGFEMKGIPLWLKTNPVPHLADRLYVSSMEHAIWVVKTNGKEDVEYTFNLPETSKFKNGIFRLSPHEKQNERFHTTQKPIKLFNELTRIHSNKGDVVLDTFMGSGTTAASGVTLERNFIGSEMDPTYFKKATDRVNRMKRKPKSLW